MESEPHILLKSAGDATINSESKAIVRGGKEASKFTSSITRSLEDQTVAEHRSPNDQTSVLDKSEHQHRAVEENLPKGGNLTSYANGTVNGRLSGVLAEDKTLLGAPENATTSAQTDDRSPHASREIDTADEEEKTSQRTHATIQKHLNHKAWTLPTPRPRVDPDGFEDPISDTFWKNVWLASATHNVRSPCF